MEKFAYSEIFHSIQGEGVCTGTLGPWLRFHLCNLQCDGFGQAFPTDPTTYKLPYKDLDVSKYDKVEDLPVFEYGCDSSYTWSKKYKHLMKKETASVIVDRIYDTMKNEHNPEGHFVHPKTKVWQHMHFTGGEPLMPHGQRAIMAILNEMYLRGNAPNEITIETNGTQTLSEEFKEYLNLSDVDVLFSISPKLYHVSGEDPLKAIMPDNWYEYGIFGTCQLKFVVNENKFCWEQIDTILETIDPDLFLLYAMPVGATKEQQENVGDIVQIAMDRGFNISGRMHCYLFGNKIGT